MNDRKLQIQMEGATNVGPPYNPGTVSAADTMGRPPPAEETERRKGLPADGEAWTHKHDMVVMGRLGRAVEGVPAAALRRIMPWFEGVTREVMYPAQGREFGPARLKAAEEELYQGQQRAGAGGETLYAAGQRLGLGR